VPTAAPDARRDARRAQLLTELVALTPQQPATCYWRAVELDALLEVGLPEGRGLDVGCGDGQLMSVLLAHAGPRELVGIDLDPREVELAAASGVYAGTHVAPADALPLPDATFDFAISNSVLEHIPDLDAALAEVARVLRPGAPLVATVPVAELDEAFAGAGVLSPLLGRDRATYLRRMDERLAHVSLWDEPRWERALRAAGFADVTFTPYLDEREVRTWERLSNWTGGLLGALAGRRRPIEVSRSLRISTGARFNRPLRRVTGPVAARALRRTPHLEGGARHGCRVVVAHRAG